MAKAELEVSGYMIDVEGEVHCNNGYYFFKYSPDSINITFDGYEVEYGDLPLGIRHELNASFIIWTDTHQPYLFDCYEQDNYY